MRRVLTNHSEVAHYWANRVQSEGSASRMFFEGDTIYSYGRHYAIAVLLDKGYVALNTAGASVSTAKHASYARQACSHLKALHVVNPNEPPASVKGPTEADVQRLLERAARARGNRGRLVAEAASRVSDFNTFSKLLGSPIRIKPIDVEGFDADKLRALIKKREDAKKRKARALELAATKAKADLLVLWRDHSREVYTYQLHGATVALRLCQLACQYGPDSYFIETSHGAKIPAPDAIRLWPVIERVRSGDKDYDVGMQLGHYRLTQIRRDGSIRVGCHDIPFAEIERMHAEMSAEGLFEVEVAA